jgi:hypothetical protein
MFFGRLAPLVIDNPPAEAGVRAMERFAAIGLAPGSFDPTPEIVGELDEGVKAGMAKLNDLGATSGATGSNGWAVFRGLGSFGTEYGKRALVARLGLGANPMRTPSGRITRPS